MLVIRVWHAGYIFSKYKINSPFKNLVLFNFKGLTCWLYIFSNTHQNIYIKSSCTLPVTWISRLGKHYSRLTQSNDLWLPKHRVLFLAFASVIPPPGMSLPFLLTWLLLLVFKTQRGRHVLWPQLNRCLLCAPTTPAYPPITALITRRITVSVSDQGT